ncbi:MAG TPA: hypothetical protein VI895_08525 [Bdellovibrionota bacterium]|nr:hypothetical protein [Bdellovibrionota bacterium]
MMLLRGLALWSGIMLVETLHGIARARFLAPRVGDRRSRQIGVFTGSLLIFVITLALIPWVGATRFSELLLLGLIWTVLTVAFEIVLGRLMFHMSWKRIWADFDLREGGLMSLGLLVMLLSPWIAAKIRHLV